MTERPHVSDLLGQTVTLHFPNGDYTTGPLLTNLGGIELAVNGWKVHEPGRYFSHNGRIYD